MDHIYETSRALYSRMTALRSLMLVRGFNLDNIHPSNRESFTFNHLLNLDATKICLEGLLLEDWIAFDRNTKTHVTHESAVEEHFISSTEYLIKADALKTNNTKMFDKIVIQYTMLSQLHALLAQKHKDRSTVTSGSSITAMAGGSEWIQP